MANLELLINRAKNNYKNQLTVNDKYYSISELFEIIHSQDNKINNLVKLNKELIHRLKKIKSSPIL